MACEGDGCRLSFPLGRPSSDLQVPQHPSLEEGRCLHQHEAHEHHQDDDGEQGRDLERRLGEQAEPPEICGGEQQLGGDGAAQRPADAEAQAGGDQR